MENAFTQDRYVMVQTIKARRSSFPNLNNEQFRAEEIERTKETYMDGDVIIEDFKQLYIEVLDSSEWIEYPSLKLPSLNSLKNENKL